MPPLVQSKQQRGQAPLPDLFFFNMHNSLKPYLYYHRSTIREMSQIFSLSPSHPMPLYAQLTRAIRFAIATGRLRVGEQLPTVRQLAVELRVNANTVAKVYTHLERDGALGTRRGVGTFVLDAPQLANSHQEARDAELMAVANRAISDASSHGFTVADLRKALLSISKGETS